MLAGEEIPHTKGFEAYSDGDVVSHAVVDALLGALAAGDIADRFSDRDPVNKGIRSLEYLVRLRPWLAAEGAEIVNLDCVLELEKPKLKPHFPAMRQNIAESLGLELGQVSLKGKTGDGVGLIGDEEAAAARVVVLVNLDARL